MSHTTVQRSIFELLTIPLFYSLSEISQDSQKPINVNQPTFCPKNVRSKHKSLCDEIAIKPSIFFSSIAHPLYHFDFSYARSAFCKQTLAFLGNIDIIRRFLFWEHCVLTINYKLIDFNENCSILLEQTQFALILFSQTYSSHGRSINWKLIPYRHWQCFIKGSQFHVIEEKRYQKGHDSFMKIVDSSGISLQ